VRLSYAGAESGVIRILGGQWAVQFETVQLSLAVDVEYTWTARAAFVKSTELQMPFQGVLGTEGFLDKFAVTFNKYYDYFVLHQAMLMNHAACAVGSLNPDPVRVGDVAGQPAQRRGLLQGSVRPAGVAEVLVLPQHGHKVALVPCQRPVGQFAAAAAGPPFRDRVRSGRLDGGAGDPGARGAEDLIERGGEAGVPVMNHELDPRPGVRRVHEQVPGLPHDPRLDGMLGGARDPGAAGTVLDHGKDVRLGAVEEAGGEEVQGQDPLCR